MAKTNKQTTFPNRVVIKDKLKDREITLSETGFKTIAGVEMDQNGKKVKRYVALDVQKFDSEKKEFVSIGKEAAKEAVINLTPDPAKTREGEKN